jgi:hypothetical protein
MNLNKFRSLSLIAALGLTAGCAGPDLPVVSRSATVPPVLSGVTTPGQAYLRELTIGAADGMRVAGWRDRQAQIRVEVVRESAEMFRFDMGPEARASYDAVRMTGYEQGLSGAWDAEALNGYLDVIEAGNARFMAIEGAGHSDYAWVTPLQAIVGVTGAGEVTLSPDRFGHAVAATALASEINVVSFQITELTRDTGEVPVPCVMAGDRLTTGRSGPEETLIAYAGVLQPGQDVRYVEMEDPGI